MQKEYVDTAIQYLHLVGGSSSECDTIPGRVYKSFHAKVILFQITESMMNN